MKKPKSNPEPVRVPTDLTDMVLKYFPQLPKGVTFDEMKRFVGETLVEDEFKRAGISIGTNEFLRCNSCGREWTPESAYLPGYWECPRKCNAGKGAHLEALWTDAG